MARFLGSLVLAASAMAAVLIPVASADDDVTWALPVPTGVGVTVSPGMEIRQQSTVCTLGFVDPIARVGYSAGHCRGAGPVTDRLGRVIGVVTSSRDNTPNGSVVRVDEVISDYETISLAADVSITNALPGGRPLVADPAPPLSAGQPVCHFGIVTGESCGTVERVNNGWFTMTNGVVSQKGDSGGPVYTLTADGRAVLVGIFNSTWGQFPAAVSWQATNQQAAADGAALGNLLTTAGRTAGN
ncbi:hypothetical protein MCEMAEM6B_00206 [Mycobacteriaceae bacterium]